MKKNFSPTGKFTARQIVVLEILASIHRRLAVAKQLDDSLARKNSQNNKSH